MRPGRGLFPFTTIDDWSGNRRHRERYDGHRRVAQDIAEEYFGAERVVQSLLTRAGL